jgi:hypothetical protein
MKNKVKLVGHLSSSLDTVSWTEGYGMVKGYPSTQAGWAADTQAMKIEGLSSIFEANSPSARSIPRI